MNRAIQDINTASKWFWRALRHGDWLWLVIAIVIASASATLIKQLGDSVEQSMIAKAANSLGADLVLRSSRPIEPSVAQNARDMGLDVRQTTSVVTMALANEKFQLISLKGVSKANSDRLPAGQKPIDQTPKTVWIEPKLQQLLDLKLGDSLLLGTQTYKVGGLLTPHSLINPMAQFAPQAQLLLTDFEQAGLLGPGSRATYELEISGDTQTLKNLQNRLEQRIEASQNSTESVLPWTLISAKAPSEDLGKTLDRAWFFLDLASLSAVLIAGMSILIASRFYLQRWKNTMALLRAYGANNRQMFRLFAGQLFWLSFFSSLIGALLGLALAWLLQPTLMQFFDPFVMQPFWIAFAIGVLSGFLVLWSFAWHALSEALKTSPMQILRAVPKAQSLWQWGLSFALLILLIALMIGLQWLIPVLTGLILLTLTLWLASQVLIWFLGIWQTRAKGWLKIAISSLLKEQGLLSIQVISIGVVLFVLMLMTFVRQDLLQTWQQTLPSDAPNTFVMNVQPDQKPQTETLLAQQGLTPELLPMVRGRLVAKNNQPMKVSEQSSQRGRNLLQREANIAVLSKTPEHNTIVDSIDNLPAGEVTKLDLSLPKVSVEAGIAELFGIQLGDQLRFDFQGQTYDYVVTSFRQVEWQSFQLNFFFIVDPLKDTAANEQLPISYLTNFYLPTHRFAQTLSPTGDTPIPVATYLTQQFALEVPGVLLIDVAAIIQQIQEIMDQASWAVSGLYGFTLIASILVLFTATLASQQNRLQSWFLLRSLGATQSTITKVGLSEFILVGLLAGILAASLAQLSAWAISSLWFDQASDFSWPLWLTSLLSGVVILVSIAWLTQRRYLKLSALQLKRLV